MPMTDKEPALMTEWTSDELRAEIQRRIDALIAEIGPECLGQDMAAKKRNSGHVCLDRRLDECLNELARRRG